MISTRKDVLFIAITSLVAEFAVVVDGVSETGFPLIDYSVDVAEIDSIE
jgi:hypothetical protein